MTIHMNCTLDRKPHVQRRLKSIPLPPSIKQDCYATFVKWVECSGPEWAVTRFKEFRDCLLQSYSAGQLTAKPEWFSSTRRGNLRGLFGRLYRIGMSNERNLKAVLFLLQVYTTVSYRRPSPMGVRKALRSIRSQPAKMLQIRNRIYPALKSLRLLKQLEISKPIPLLQVLPGRKTSVEKLPWDIYYSFQGHFAKRFRPLMQMAVGFSVDIDYDPLYDPVLDLNEVHDSMYSVRYVDFLPGDRLVGYIHVTENPGLKERYFAAPNLVFQRALDPLKWALADVCKKLPWDCTHDQRKADKIVSEHLTNGSTVFSFDLTSATDHFPWHWQKHILFGLIKPKYQNIQSRDFFCEIIEKGHWAMEIGGQVIANIQWSKGQPLGLGPSFFLFAISHGLLLYILNDMRWDKKFFVLGDDVVILDKTLAQRYKEVLDKWEIPISTKKSFASNKVAQFAGKTFLKNLSFWIPKWNPFTKDNLLDMEAWWYPGLTKGMKDYPLIQKVLALPEPYGIGRNPEGLSIEERLPSELMQAIVSRDMRRELRARPSSTIIDRHKLTVACRDLDEDLLYDLVSRLYENPDISPNVDPTRVALIWDQYLAKLLDGTETPGYPSQRLRWSDPYSLGRLQSWRRLFTA